MKYIKLFENFIQESLLQYDDAEGLETVYIYKLDDINKDDYIGTIDYEGNYDIYSEDELTKDQIKEIKAKAKEIKAKAKIKAKELAKRWVGWFVITKPFSGDLNSWKKGELVKVYKSEDNPSEFFIETANINIDAYDDIEKVIFDNNLVRFNSDEHKAHAKYIAKIDNQGYVKSWEKYK
jgi:hypothetical protein